MLKSYAGNLRSLSTDYIINTFKSYNMGMYHPLVTLSYSLEASFFGINPIMFHLDNIFLHIINVILVFFVIFKLSESFWLSFIVTILFSIHPTRVETVSWISARKDMLYAPFYLVSILFYIKSYDYIKITKYIFIVLSLFMFLLSCLSKSMAITLPFVLILIDLYKNKFNIHRIKIYSIYIVISIIFIIVTIDAHYYNQYSSLVFQFSTFNHMVNFINAHFNILFYFNKLLIPINLYCLYSPFYDNFQMPPWYVLYSPSVLYMLIFIAFLSLRKTKVLFFGLMFFLITILPVSNVFPIGISPVGDRYTYIPYIGLFFIFAKFIIFIYDKIKLMTVNSKFYKYLLILLCIIVCIFLFYLSYKQVIVWVNDDAYSSIISISKK